jgi:hypothetical protein
MDEEASLWTEAIKRDLLVTADHGEYMHPFGVQIAKHFIILNCSRGDSIMLFILVIMQATMSMMMSFHSGLILGQRTILLKSIMLNLQIILLQTYSQEMILCLSLSILFQILKISLLMIPQRCICQDL